MLDRLRRFLLADEPEDENVRIAELERRVTQLAEACQLLTQGVGEGGYYPMLGEPKMERALTLMREAGVEPVYYKGKR